MLGKVKSLALGAMSRATVNRPMELFIKNTALCKGLKPTYTVRRLPAVGRLRGRVKGLRILKLITEAPMKGGRNYDGPKVAKFLVG